jgi:hypothetical protein
VSGNPRPYTARPSRRRSPARPSRHWPVVRLPAAAPRLQTDDKTPPIQTHRLLITLLGMAHRLPFPASGAHLQIAESGAYFTYLAVSSPNLRAGKSMGGMPAHRHSASRPIRTLACPPLSHKEPFRRRSQVKGPWMALTQAAPRSSRYG